MDARSEDLHRGLPSASAECHQSLIVTADVASFERHFANQLGRSVHVHATAVGAQKALLLGGFQRFFADFLPLPDHWSGIRFARHLRAMPEHAELEIWLMADRWTESLHAVACQAGAAGLVRRSPRGLVKLMAHEDSWGTSTAGIEDELSHVEALFGRFAGPLASLHTDNARAALAAGNLAPSVDAYFKHLVERLTLTERKKAFLAAAQADPLLAGLL